MPYTGDSRLILLGRWIKPLVRCCGPVNLMSRWSGKEDPSQRDTEICVLIRLLITLVMVASVGVVFPGLERGVPVTCHLPCSLLVPFALSVLIFLLGVAARMPLRLVICVLLALILVMCLLVCAQWIWITGLFGLWFLVEIVMTLIQYHMVQNLRDRSNVHMPRSIALAFVNLVEIILIYALFYSATQAADSGSLTKVTNGGSTPMTGVGQAVWMSTLTMFAMESELKAQLPGAKVLMASQLFLGLFFVAVILAIGVSNVSSGSPSEGPHSGEADAG